jgi:alkyl sulfatase BDS1-like metallo-beta-lactamase superfamily hydrolase
LTEAAGGTEAILERARKAAAEGQLQLALELSEVAGNTAAAHRLRAELLERLAAQTTNGVARNIYLEAAAAERKALL